MLITYITKTGTLSAANVTLTLDTDSQQRAEGIDARDGRRVRVARMVDADPAFDRAHKWIEVQSCAS